MAYLKINTTAVFLLIKLVSRQMKCSEASPGQTGCVRGVEVRGMRDHPVCGA